MKRQEFDDTCKALGLLPISETEYADRGVHAKWTGRGIALARRRIGGAGWLHNQPKSTNSAERLESQLRWWLRV
jgi:hypothetical protein